MQSFFFLESRVAARIHEAASVWTVPARLPVWNTSKGTPPLTYQVDALRGAMVVGGQHIYGLATDIGVLLAVLVGLITLTARLYPNIVR